MKPNNRIGQLFFSRAFLLEALVVALGGLIYGAFIVRSGAAAVGLTAGLLLFLVLSRSPVKALALLLMVVPFSGMELFSEPIVDLPGARPFLLLGAFVAVIVFLNLDKATRMPRLGAVIASVLVLFFALAVARALPNKDAIGFAAGQEWSNFGFILSLFVKPLIYLMPLIIAGKFIRDADDIEFLIKTIVASVSVFSAYFMYYYIFQVKDKGNIEAAWEYVGEALGLHKNQAASIYTLCFPILLARYFARKDKLSLLGIALSLPSIGFMYSRTTYVAVVVAVPLYLAFSKRSRFVPVLVIAGALLSFAVSETIVERASTGLAEGDLGQISSGRVEGQWIPIVEEYLADPQKLLFGQGSNAVLVSEAYQKGLIAGGANHPHNMYLELIIDAGLLALIPMLLLYGILLKNTRVGLRTVHDPTLREYQCGAFVSMITYFIGGMTQGSFFPTIAGSYFWTMAAISLLMTKIDMDLQQKTAIDVNSGTEQ